MSQVKKNKVGVIRLSGHPIDLPSGYALQAKLGNELEVIGELVAGGREHDNRELATIDELEVRAAVDRLIRQGVNAMAIVGIFSPSFPDDELRVRAIIQSATSSYPIVLSHQVGGLGFIERENATILQASIAAAKQQHQP